MARLLIYDAYENKVYTYANLNERGMSGQLQAQRLHRRPCVGIGNAGLLQPQKLLGAAGGCGSFVGITVGKGRGFHTGKIIGDAQQNPSRHRLPGARHRRRQRRAGGGTGGALDQPPGTAFLRRGLCGR